MVVQEEKVLIEYPPRAVLDRRTLLGSRGREGVRRACTTPPAVGPPRRRRHRERHGGGGATPTHIRQNRF